jgi:glutaredoxin
VAALGCSCSYSHIYIRLLFFAILKLKERASPGFQTLHYENSILSQKEEFIQENPSFQLPYNLEKKTAHIVLITNFVCLPMNLMHCAFNFFFFFFFLY